MPEIDLHGLSVDEARRELDQWIDGLVRAHEPFGRIIHGRGKGILQQFVVREIAQHRCVERVEASGVSHEIGAVTYIVLASGPRKNVY